MIKKHVSVIILAAGQGKRMMAKSNKQFFKIEDKPILAYTIQCFLEHAYIDDIILVINQNEEEVVKNEVLNKYFKKNNFKMAYGGKERYNSVYNGLKVLDENTDYVLIHDGARPLVNKEEISIVVDTLRERKACVVGVPVKNTYKLVNEFKEIEYTPPREKLYSVMTPQAFHRDLIVQAYQIGIDECAHVTDDAMMVELFTDEKVLIVDGSYENIKITIPDDILTMKRIIEGRSRHKK